MKAAFFVCAVALVIEHSLAQPSRLPGKTLEVPELKLKINDLVSNTSLEQIAKADVLGIFNIDINGLFDEVLENLGRIISDNADDPLPMDDQTLELLGILGSVKLTSGSLSNLSTIKRVGDIVISYSTTSKRVSFLLPLGFDELVFDYKYKTRVTLITWQGGVEGKIKDVQLNIQITYDPNVKAFSLDGLSMKNTGKVSVKFTGNPLVDWLSNAITSLVTTVLHPIIILVVQTVVKSIGNAAIAAANEYIHG